MHLQSCQSCKYIVWYFRTFSVPVLRRYIILSVLFQRSTVSDCRLRITRTGEITKSHQGRLNKYEMNKIVHLVLVHVVICMLIVHVDLCNF